jgi:tetratricopeptide (TPR) repeat protein
VRAIADLNRAIELAPSESQYFYQRANFHGANRQPMLALADLDQAISLKADHAAARISRAGLQLSRLEATGNGRIEDIITDVDMARSAAARESDVHFEAGRLYAGAGAQEQALEAFDHWLALHRADSRAADARAGACRARAVLNRELNRALDDCNAAVRDRLGMPLPLESRGLVHLRLRNFEKAITDYDKVLAEQPRNAWALYGRGLAKLGKGSTADGELDIAKAKAANPRVVANAISRGLVP